MTVRQNLTAVTQSHLAGNTRFIVILKYMHLLKNHSIQVNHNHIIAIFIIFRDKYIHQCRKKKLKLLPSDDFRF